MYAPPPTSNPGDTNSFVTYHPGDYDNSVQILIPGARIRVDSDTKIIIILILYLPWVTRFSVPQIEYPLGGSSKKVVMFTSC